MTKTTTRGWDVASMPQQNQPTDTPVQKHFVLDTNVLLHNPNAIYMFAEHEVVIPLAVIEELDHFKPNSDDTGRNARQVIREIDRLRRKGRLFEGVPVNDQGQVVLSMEMAEGWDLHPDGDRFIASVFPGAATGASALPEWRYLVVMNWFTELQERLGN